MTLGPSIAEVQQALIASSTEKYRYELEHGRLYVRWEGGKACVGLTLMAVPTPSDSGAE